MTEQSKAQRLADALETSHSRLAAAELRRLDALNAELVEALQKFINNYNTGSYLISWDVDKAEELLAKAKEHT